MPVYKLLPVLLLFCCANLTAQITPANDDENKVFTKVEQEAEFPGGPDGWRKYLQKNLNAGVGTDNGAPSGMYTVVVKFIIRKDGTLSDVKAETILGYGMDEEVVRIIQRSGKWIPAMQNKRAVNAYRRQPVTFMIEEDDLSVTTAVPYTLFTGQNLVRVDVPKKNRGNVRITISQGTITPTDDEGQYTVRLNETGRAIITAYNSKTDKIIGAVSIEVKKEKQ